MMPVAPLFCQGGRVAHVTTTALLILHEYLHRLYELLHRKAALVVVATAHHELLLLLVMVQQQVF